jgi:hypothetical protein
MNNNQVDDGIPIYVLDLSVYQTQSLPCSGGMLKVSGVSKTLTGRMLARRAQRQIYIDEGRGTDDCHFDESIDARRVILSLGTAPTPLTRRVG